MDVDLLRAVFDEAPIALAVVDATFPFHVVAANAQFAGQLPGDGEPAGRSLLDLVPTTSEKALEAALRAAAGGTLQRVLDCRRSGNELRYTEIVVRSLGPSGDERLLYVGRDVTHTEMARRSLESSNVRLHALAGIPHRAVKDASAVTRAAVIAASTICEGAALYFTLEHDGTLRRTDTHALPAGVWAPARPSRTQVVSIDRAIHTGETQVSRNAPSLTWEERALMMGTNASWLVVTPVRGRLRTTFGALVTLWRRMTGPTAEEIRDLELAALQTGMTLEHARLLSASEAERGRLDLLLDSVPDSVWMVDGDGRVRTNVAGRRLLDEPASGAPPSGVAELSSRFASMAHPAPIEGDGLGLLRALRGETVRSEIAVLRRPTSGRETILLTSAAPLHGANGDVIGAVAVSTDATNQRHADDAMRLLAHSSAEFGATLDVDRSLQTVAQSVVSLRLADWCVVDLCDDEGVRRVACTFGDREDAARARALQRTPPRSLRDVLGDALESGKTKLYARVREQTLEELSRDPSEARLLAELHPRSLLLVPIVARNRVYGLMQLLRTTSFPAFTHDDAAVAEDLARRAAMALDNARLFDEARAADRRKNEFLGVLSHELRTPLTSVMVWAGILRQTSEPEKVRHAAEVIERNIRIQTALINDLLDLTSISRGKMKLDRQRHDLSAIITSALEIVQQVAEHQSVHVVRHGLRDPIMIEGDAKRLQQVFWNILANAVKFSRADGAVTVTVGREDARAVVRIRDTGEGISPEFLPQVFDMFRQGDAAGGPRRGGLGIGLALARQLVELHGGRIAVRSEGRGRGSEFTVTLPALDSATARIDVPPADAGALRGVAVLVVEDVREMAAGERALLEHYGARVLAAQNGNDALLVLRSEHVDVVLCDLWMPEMDGFALMREVRNDQSLGVIPMIAVSSLASPADNEQIAAAGFDAFVPKPFETAALLRVIREVLGTRAPTEPTWSGRPVRAVR